MPKDGWIKLHRKLRDNPIWQKNPFSKGQAWVDLLLRAQHQTYNFSVKDKIIKLQPGQVYIFKKEIARDWGWSRTKVTNFLNTLAGRNRNKNNQMITTSEPLCENETLKKTHFGVLVTITKWGLYQTGDLQKDTKKDMRKTPKRHKQECKECKEIRSIIELMNKILDTSFKPTTTITQKLIKGRLSEGYSIQDFKQVIEYKKKDWENTEQEKYLRPQTLFRPSNFESYLQQAKKAEEKKKGRIL